MRVFIAGGSGLIGRHLAKSLLDTGHQPIILSRNADAVRRDRCDVALPGDHAAIPPSPVDGKRRSTAATPSSIWPAMASSPTAGMPRSSARFAIAASIAPRHLVTAIKNAQSRPKVFVQGSADRLLRPCRETKSSPSRARRATIFSRSSAANARMFLDRSMMLGVRRAIVRTGIVLAAGAGALKIMTPIFKLGPGAPIGSAGGLVGKGDQWMSWIHLDDIVGDFQTGLENDQAVGPLNGTAPNPVRNAEFAKTFSSVLKKPYTPWRVYLPFGPPDGLLRLVLGEVATIVTTGQRVLPTKPLDWVTSSNTPTLPMPCARSSRRLRPQHPRSRTIIRPAPARIIEDVLRDYLKANPTPMPAANVAASVITTQARRSSWASARQIRPATRTIGGSWAGP